MSTMTWAEARRILDLPPDAPLDEVKEKARAHGEGLALDRAVAARQVRPADRAHVGRMLRDGVLTRSALAALPVQPAPPAPRPASATSAAPPPASQPVAPPPAGTGWFDPRSPLTGLLRAS